MKSRKRKFSENMNYSKKRKEILWEFVEIKDSVFLYWPTFWDLMHFAHRCPTSTTNGSNWSSPAWTVTQPKYSVRRGNDFQNFWNQRGHIKLPFLKTCRDHKYKYLLLVEIQNWKKSFNHKINKNLFLSNSENNPLNCSNDKKVYFSFHYSKDVPHFI